MKKTIKTGKEARDALRRGVNQVANVVGSTLGPSGRNVLIFRKNKRPQITNDGVSIARQIELKDEVENLGAQVLIEAAQRTNDLAGDGTTTATVLAQAIINEGFTRIDPGASLVKNPANVMEVYHEIEEAEKTVIAELKKSAKPIKTREDIEKVATSSVENPEIGKVIAGMIDKVGQDGFITVEEGFNLETETEIMPGMQFLGTYVSPYMVTNNKREAVYEDVPVLITNHELDDVAEVSSFVDKMLKAGIRKVVLIAPKYGKDVTLAIVNTNLLTFKGQDGKVLQFKTLAIKAPSLTDEQLEDIAVYVGGKFVDKEKGMEVSGVMPTELGQASKIIVNRDEVAVAGGKEDKKAVEARIEKLKEQSKVEKTEMFKKKIERRIASLSGGVGVIRVGALTEVERGYLKHKIEDAVNATKAALEEGVVKGGGVALKEIADKLPEGNILKSALKAPYEKIQENAGGNLKIGPTVLDPVKVTRTALENACSVARTLLTTESTIAEHDDEIENFKNYLKSFNEKLDE